MSTHPGGALVGDPVSVTAIILSYNEAIHIERCISGIRDLVEKVVVVDSFSTDGTDEIARRLGAEVHQRTWRNHADQFRWALQSLPIETEWTMRLDCDEYLEEGLKSQLRLVLPQLDRDVTGLEFRLKVIFKGRPILHGGYHRNHLMRCWRTGLGSIEDRWMDERVRVSEGTVRRIDGGDLVDASLKNIDWWTTKHNGYATRQMIDFIHRELRLDEGASVRPAGSRWRAFLRNKVYSRSPLYLRAVAYFFQRYFLRLGFLDGKYGFLWHFLQGFWMFVLMDAKIDEARQYLEAHGPDSFGEYLRVTYGIEETAAIGREASRE